MKCDIIIPVWNKLEHTKVCLDNLEENTRYPYSLIIIDNGSEDGTKEYLDELQISGRFDLKVIRNEHNLGFIKAVNQGMRIAGSDYICLLNNDTIPGKGWLTELVQFSMGHKEIGIMNPEIRGHELKGVSVNEYAEALSHNKGKYTEVNQCFGHCMFFKRDVMDKIGLMDESFGIGGYDDTDYCMRAYKAGYLSACVNSSYVYHKQHVSFNALGSDRKKLIEKGEREYFKKWPKHLRIALIFSTKGLKSEKNINNCMESMLFLAREWCWINMWILGDVLKNKAAITGAQRDIKMPIHQNIKYGYFQGAMSAINIILRIIERCFGTKRRKKYDLIITNDKNAVKILKTIGFIHRIKTLFLEFNKDERGILRETIDSIHGKNKDERVKV